MNSFNTMINRSLNFSASTANYLLNKSDIVLAPTILGYIGGMLTKAGPEMGFFQGAVSGLYHTVIHMTIANHVERNKGDTDDKIKPETVSFLKMTGAIVGIAIPILITQKYGEELMKNLIPYVDDTLITRWVFSYPFKTDYSWTTGILINIAPAIAQHLISYWRQQDQTKSKII